MLILSQQGSVGDGPQVELAVRPRHLLEVRDVHGQAYPHEEASESLGKMLAVRRA